MGTLFLFGAGASFGSGPCQPENPPLGGELIMRMREEGGVAATIDGDLLECFKKDPEKGMVRFFEERNQETSALLRQMSGYLAKFQISQDNLYIELINILKKRKSICLSTTNYDLLLEQAISLSGKKIQYHSRIRLANAIPLLKIHGSVNFIPEASVTGATFSVPTHGKASIIDAPVDICMDYEKIIDYCNSDTSLSPAVAMYHPEKIVLHCRNFVEHQKEDFKKEVRKSSKIFIIGLKIHQPDVHIWGELEKTKANIYIVDRNHEATAHWKKSIKKSNIYHIADSFEHSITTIKSILNL